MWAALWAAAGEARAQPGAAVEPEPEVPVWETVGLGPGMLVIPPRPELGRPGRVDFGAGGISIRRVRLLAPNAGWETVMGLVVHDEQVFRDAWDWYNEGDDQAVREKWGGLGLGWLFLPFVAGSTQLGVGGFFASSSAPPFAHVSGGIMITPMFFRLNQPGMKFDIGSGVYAGVGVALTRGFGFSARLSYDALMFHQLWERGYGHVWTGLATIDFKFPRKRGRDMIAP